MESRVGSGGGEERGRSNDAVGGERTEEGGRLDSDEEEMLRPFLSMYDVIKRRSTRDRSRDDVFAGTEDRTRSLTQVRGVRGRGRGERERERDMERGRGKER